MNAQNSDILDRAVAAWHEGDEPESLSGAAKSTLFSEIQSEGGQSSTAFVPGITRAWRWAFLGSVPVVAIATVLIMVGDSNRPASARELTASKVNGQLVFTLANGNADHLVYRSTDPKSFNVSQAVKMARSSRGTRYAENATGGPNLVFYRID